jgi:hypothetical protein
MYRWLREIHLALGVFSFGFLVLYAVSAVQMGHFNIPVRRSEAKVIVPAGLEDARAVARELKLRGVLRQIAWEGGVLRLRAEKLGTVYSITYFRDRGEALVRSEDGGVLGVLNRLHHTAGFWHESPALQVWGAVVAIVSAALILLALTGIYLWTKLRNERKAGTLILATGLAYSLSLIALIRGA